MALRNTGATAGKENRSHAHCINLACTQGLTRLTLFSHELCFQHLQHGETVYISTYGMTSRLSLL